MPFPCSTVLPGSTTMGLLGYLRLESTKGANLDTRTLEPARRTFGPWEFVPLWVVTGSFNIGSWTTGFVVIALGLKVWQVVLTVIIGNILVGLLAPSLVAHKHMAATSAG
ncbi:hypothetical protein BJX68DRAFT_260770 [Aspergillus pseudodeflectus]|uniref:Uncharacterized protein n=1 Tax=Aspergillus pseudodeflectus TaxID=176178 RepID=A0ABR4LES4_9EURO